MNTRNEFIGFRIKHYYFLKYLGNGTYAKVYQVFDQKNHMNIACKVIPKTRIDESPKLFQLLNNEIQILKKCNNINVIKFIDVIDNYQYIFIFTQFCNGGDLEMYLKKRKYLKQAEAVQFLKQILNGFKGIHDVKAMHRDFKCANVLLNNGVAKIADLGFARILKNQDLAATVLGTSLTMAPQILQQNIYGFECDVWSVGVVYYQLLYGDYPYYESNSFELLKKIKKTRPNFPESIPVSNQSKDFINKCLTVDYKKRISWKQIYEHPLIKSQSNGLFSIKPSKINNQNKQISQNNIIQQKKTEFKYQNNYPEKFRKQPQRETNLNRYIQIYNQKRNSLRLIFDYGITLVLEISDISFNQNLYAFLLCKKAYHSFRDFNQSLKQNKNIFLLKEYYLKQLFYSPQYRNFTDDCISDFQLVKLYAQGFLSQIKVKSLNHKVQKQLNIDQIFAQSKKIFDEQMIAYAFQLYNERDNVKQKKIIILKLITFICDLINQIKVTSKQYQKKIESQSEKNLEDAFENKIPFLYQ